MKKSLMILFSIVMLLILASCSKSTKTAQEYWDSGLALYDVGNYERAITQYKNLIKFYPDDALTIQASFSIADIYKNNIKDYDMAVKHYKQIEKNYPNSEKTPNAMFMIGYIYANEIKDLNKAKDAYNYFIKKYPKHVLVSSAEWEMKNLGKSLEEIQQINLTD